MSQQNINRAKIRWRCYRGMRELDLILIQFFEQHFDELTHSEQQAFAYLLEQNDPDLLAWLLQQSQPQDEALKQIVKRITT
ncbi:MAG: succinate dehydrogenase assembly factor 2 [Gammaproteobacteria bacterium]